MVWAERLKLPSYRKMIRDLLLIHPVAAPPPPPPPSIFLSPPLVHERHGALGLAAEDPGEELQCQAHVDGHKDVRGVDDHGDGGEEDGVEDGHLPGLQDIDAGDEQVLVVQPGQVLPQVLEEHSAGWTEGERKRRWRHVRKCEEKQWIQEFKACFLKHAWYS